MRKYDPWRDALSRYPQVHIEWHSIAPLHAVWAPGEAVIVVDESISTVERRCALAHEIAHMDTGDRPTSMCWFSARQETATDKLAARRLIQIEHLADAARWCSDSRELAHELDVTLNVLAMRVANLHPSERGLVDRVALLRGIAA